MKISPFIFNRIWLPYAYGRQYPQSPLHILRWLLRTQYWSRGRIGEYQLEQIRMQLKEASDKSDYYKSALSGVDLGNLALTTLQSLPKLSKDVIQERSEELFTDKRDKGIRHKTSGSTGIPVEIYLSRDAEAYRRAGHLRMLHWWGIKPSDRSGLIWGNLEISQRKVNLLKRWKRDLLNREYFIDVFKLRSGTVEQYFQELVDFEPVYLRGYTSGLVQFAELVTSQHLDPAELKLKVIFVTSEILSEKDRRFISEIFGCPVANEYGAADGGLFAYECPEGGMHIFEEAVYIFTGEKGEACVNEYHNLLMPLINYEIGDRIE
ncbi:MAG: phenylacetate--CoA ligase family protein, partial [Candidatus Cloacimonetes bacterium]|nr:phenylacetate--CoA ligase family protein [Candidatus Cloacimonadota bacterium]